MAVLLILLCLMSAAKASIDPNFDLTSLTGVKSNLQSQHSAGKWLLVMFWATDCVICMQQKPLISKFHEQHKDSIAEVLGIALDGYTSIAKINAYLAEHSPSFPSYTADYNALAKSYGEATGEVLRGTPTYLLYSPEGALVANNPGPVSKGAIEKFIKKYRQNHR